MKKRELNRYPTDSLEYVILHARWQRSRGRNPSATLRNWLNPRRALETAETFGYIPVTDLYWNESVPADYTCSHCGATSCKLWREYQTEAPKLLCARCTAKDQDKDISSIDRDGRTKNAPPLVGRSDSIGWYIPAVPTEWPGNYWGYTMVPRVARDWWHHLKTLPDNRPMKTEPATLQKN